MPPAVRGVVALLILATVIAAGAQQPPREPSAQELYQRGLVQEHAAGDLPLAARLFSQAARTAGVDRALAARALVRLGAVEEKLGRRSEAVRAYAEVVRAFPDQRSAAGAAQQRLTALGPARTPPSTSSGAAQSEEIGTAVRRFVLDYCVRCHDAKRTASTLDLDAASRRPVGESPAAWEAVVRRLRVRQDPPAGGARPDDATYRSVIAQLEQRLDAAYAADTSAGPTARLIGTALAERMARFVWNAPPDAVLLEAARRGDLQQPAALQRQVARMLADPKALALVDAFFLPWLSIDRLGTAHPDPTLFPEANAALLQAMATETRLFVQSQLREDRDAIELLTADYTFVNDDLARHYGLPGVAGPAFTRVRWPDANRAGVLGQAGPLTALSPASRTSPTVRGVYVLTRFLGLEAPPPPANVPALNEHVAAPGTMRERIGAHKTNPSCASCHARFDPLGLALEQFDAVGRWRTQDAGLALDVTGTFIDGTRIDGPAGLRAGLLKYRDAYYLGITRQLLARALNRSGGGRVYDFEMAAVRTIARNAAKDGHRWSSLLAGLMASAPFQAAHVVP